MARFREITRRFCLCRPREPRVRFCRIIGFQRLQPSVEVAGLDGTNIGVDDLATSSPLGRRDDACGNRRGDRSHHDGDIGRRRDRRQIELHRPRARCNDALEAEPHRCRITVKGEFHDPPGQRFGFGVEQCFGGARRAVPAPLWLAGSALPFGPREVAFRGPLHLNLQVRFRHQRISFDQINYDVSPIHFIRPVQASASLRSNLSCTLDTTVHVYCQFRNTRISPVVCA